MPTALITGITGQDGSFLARLLLEKGYRVHGAIRRTSIPNLSRLEGILDKIHLHSADLIDQMSLHRLIATTEPDEVYNLASQSFVATSFSQPVFTSEVTGLGTLRLLEAIRAVDPTIRLYQASSSEMFGLVGPECQNEGTPFHPRSPYGCAKVFAHHCCVNYREAYGMHVSCGILFNHESINRGIEFVTQKVARGVARIVKGLDCRLELGNITASRDWGWAGDYVNAMWLMLQQDSPDDYVIATGVGHTVEELLRTAFECEGLCWRDYVETDPVLLRPSDVPQLLGDATKAREKLGWEPSKRFEQMICEMVQYQLLLLDSPDLRSTS